MLADDFGALRPQPPPPARASPLFLHPGFHDWVKRLAPDLSLIGRAQADAPAEPRPAPPLAPASEPPKAVAETPRGETPARRSLVQRGLAAWYQHPGVTASGERYNPDGLTAAHARLPLGSRVQVVNEATGKSVVVRVNDRISAKAKSRKTLAIELSRGSARKIGLAGIARVSIYRED